jgi:hypothetical protein
LGTELAVAFDRIDTLQRILQERLGLSRAEIDGYKPTDAVDAERQLRRAELAQRLLRPFREFRDDRIARGTHKG